MNGKELEKRDKGIPILIEIDNKLYKIDKVSSEGTCICLECKE